MTLERDWQAEADSLTLEVSNIIDGKIVAPTGESTIEKLSPRNGDTLFEFTNSSRGDVEAAVQSAQRSFADGRWSGKSAEERKRILLSLADLVEKNRDRLALLETIDVGKAITSARDVDVTFTAATLRFYAEAADKISADVYGVDQGNLSFQLLRPHGVVGGIVGWNFPLVLAACKIGPALATGNSLLLKPSEFSPLSTGLLAQLALEAGVPDGVLNVIHGDRSVGESIARHNDIDLLTFTGSTATGKQLIAASASSNMKRLILECGGKAANIVFADAPDLPRIADAVVARAFWNQGQVCTASSRLIVAADVKDELLKLIGERAAMLRPGDPLAASTTFGALASKLHHSRVKAFIAEGRQCADLAFEGDAALPFEAGFYVQPTIFHNVKQDHRIAQEEIFGPVLSVLSFTSEEEAIQLANNTIFGLSAIAWTRDLGRAHRLAYGLKVGWTVINGTTNPLGGPTLGVVPNGGHKQSGWGCEGGLAGLKEYLTSTSVQIFV